MRVLVTGATGFIGSRLVPTLKRRGHDVAVLTRDADSYDGEADTVYEGDVLEAGSFEHALDGVDAAYYLIHSMDTSDDFAEKDRRGAHHFQRAASDAGVDRVLYLSGLGEDRATLSKHLKSRREVEHILGEGTFDLTTLRAAVIIGSGNTSFDIVKQLATRLPVMLTPQWVHVDCQPVAVSDVVAYLVGALETSETAGKTYDVGGEEVLTYGDLLERTADAAGSNAFIVPIPVLTPRLSAYWVALVTDVPTSIALPLIRGLKNEVVVRDDSIRDDVPIELTAHGTAIERALGSSSDPEATADHAVEKLDRIGL
ncbi:NAD(P)H-binding protein [Halogranum rubrum]|uniref:NAD(P)-binding domain-containing protein n=1 Tax=Halogranum salarium B-1 TaxID=1210908 RepID=J3A6Y5_9EURY|nr:NAD(P)H-binding protein [Halogranum salarium]EJN61308.1 hypothetical protein HSB1_03490 [Halogranum salarium B-1]